MSTTKDRTTKGTFAPGNRAAQTHGLRSGLVSSKLPKGMSRLQSDLSRFRRRLEADAASVHGDRLTVAHLSLIATCVSHERRRRLAERWMAKLWDAGTLSTDELDKLQGIIANASQRRDDAVAALLVSGGDMNPLLAFLQQQHDEPGLPPPPREQDRADIETGEELAHK